MWSRTIRAMPWIVLLSAVVLAIVGPPKKPAVGSWKPSRYDKDVQSRLFCERAWINPGARLQVDAEIRNAGSKPVSFGNMGYIGLNHSLFRKVYADEIGDIDIASEHGSLDERGVRFSEHRQRGTRHLCLVSLEPGATHKFQLTDVRCWRWRRWGPYSVKGSLSLYKLYINGFDNSFSFSTINIWIFPWRGAAIALAVLTGLLIATRALRKEQHR